MNTLVAASLQMGMQMPLTRKEFRADFERFLKVAVAKHSDVVVGCELGAAMVGLPFVDRKHREALLNVRKGQSAKASLVARLRGTAEKWNPRWSDADTPKLLRQTLRARKGEIWEFYDRTFSELAAQYQTVLVAPSAWLADPVDGRIRHIACVYEADGRRVGYQAKVLLSQGESQLARPGTLWHPIETSAGLLGVSLGYDSLLPEVGRLFAARGASLLISQLACANDLQWGRGHRAAALRCVENELFGCVSCLVGADRTRPDADTLYRGHSMLLAPLELSPQRNGVLIRMDNAEREGMVVSTLDYNALKDAWQASEPRFRQEFQRIWQVYSASQGLVDQSNRMLSDQSLAEDMADADVTIVESRAAPDPPDAPAAPVTPEVTPPPEDEDDALADALTLDDLHVVDALEAPWTEADAAPAAKARPNARPTYRSRGNLDETQEMDSLPKAGSDHASS